MSTLTDRPLALALMQCNAAGLNEHAARTGRAWPASGDERALTGMTA